MDRLNRRMGENMRAIGDLPQTIHNVNQHIKEGLARPYVPGSGLRQAYEDFKRTYSDPANLVADALTGFIVGKLAGEPAVEGPAGRAATAEELAAKAKVADAAKNFVLKQVRKIPGAGTVLDLKELHDSISSILRNPQGESPPPPPVPEAPTGPPNMWGQRIPPENPALNSPVRSLPGQVGPERIYGPRPKPAAPIGPRKGLLLNGEVSAPPATAQDASEAASGSSAANYAPPHSRVIHGESALKMILTGQDNANLLKIARSRGINVSRESVLKPGAGDKLLIQKIVDDFSPEELADISAQYMENSRFRHDFGDIGPEVWKTLSLQTYFPDVKIPQSVLKRTQQAIEAAGGRQAASDALRKPPGAASEDLTNQLKQSVAAARKRRTGSPQ